MSEVMLDVRFAVRALRRAPGYAIAVLWTLALGIGCNTTIFSVVHGVLLTPLDFPDEARLVSVQAMEAGGALEPLAPADVLDLEGASPGLVQVAAYVPATIDHAAAGREPERLAGVRVTATFFSALGARAVHGRLFSAEADARGGEHRVVLSERVWRHRFGTDPAVVGSSIRLNDVFHLVVGVLARDHAYPENADAWVLGPGAVPEAPIPLPELELSRELRYLSVVGRVEPGLSLAETNARLAAFGRGLALAFPGTNAGRSFRAAPLREVVIGDSRNSLVLLWVAVGIVLLIVCVNTAGLALARTRIRGRELRIRTALGASRGRLGRQLLNESLVMAVLGGTLGVGLAVLATRLLPDIAPSDLPRLEEIGIDAGVLAYAAAVSVTAGFASGLMPAWHASRERTLGRLRQGAPVRAGLARPALVGAQAGLTLTLLVAAGLVLTSFARLSAVPAGFDGRGVTAVHVPLPGARYPTAEAQGAFYDRLREQLLAAPGVDQVALAYPLPVAPGMAPRAAITIEGRPPSGPGNRPVTTLAAVSSGYFRVLGIRVRAGRAFDEGDGAEGRPSVAVINAAMADRYWPDERPVGARINLGPEAQPAWFEILGVVGDVRTDGPGAPVPPTVYLPYRQFPVPLLHVLVRGPAGPGEAATVVRSATRALDASLPIGTVQSVESLGDRAVAGPRFRSLVLALFGAAALALAAIGIAGVAYQTTAERTREFGVRLAMGATGGDILVLVLRRGLAPVAIGGILGLVVAAVAARLLRGLLYGVGALDPATYAVAAALLAVVAMGANYLPARRAARVSPINVLRHE